MFNLPSDSAVGSITVLDDEEIEVARARLLSPRTGSKENNSLKPTHTSNLPDDVGNQFWGYLSGLEPCIFWELALFLRHWGFSTCTAARIVSLDCGLEDWSKTHRRERKEHREKRSRMNANEFGLRIKGTRMNTERNRFQVLGAKIGR